MKQSILKHFNLAPDYSKSLYKGGAYQTFYNDVLGVIRDKAFIALTGNIGAGKTTLYQDVKKSLGAESIVVTVRCLDKEHLGIASIINALIYDLEPNETVPHNIEARSRKCNRILGRHAVTENKKIVMVIENAHRLHWKTLLSLKELREMDFAGHSPLFGIILIGHPSLQAKIERLKEIYLRMDFISMTAAAGWMDETERQRYLKHIYGDLLTSNMRAKVAFMEETPQEMNFLVESRLEQAWFAGREELQESDFEISMKALKDKLDLSNREIANMAGHDRSTVSKVLSGKNTNPAIVEAVKNALEQAAQRNAPEIRKAVNQ